MGCNVGCTFLCLTAHRFGCRHAGSLLKAFGFGLTACGVQLLELGGSGFGSLGGGQGWEALVGMPFSYGHRCWAAGLLRFHA